MAPYTPRVPNIRERALLYGPPGAGKSNALMTVMRRQVDDFFYILDTEDDWEFSLGEDEKNDALLERGNFDITVVRDNRDFEETLAALASIAEKIKPGEHFIYDKLTPAYQAAQNWYTYQIFGTDLAGVQMQVRGQLEEKRREQQKKGGKGDRTAPTFDQLRDWGTIYGQYDKIPREYMKIATVAHVWLIADVKQIGENTNPEKVKMYRPYGGMPAGKPDIDVLPHSVLHFDHDNRTDEFTISTVKDRGERYEKRRMEEVEWVDFSVTYLRDVARWKPVDGEKAAKKRKKK